MRHRVAGKTLGRTTSHRKAMRRNLAASLFQHGTVRTTEAKAKDIRRFVERLITIAKAGTLHARRRVIQLLQDRELYHYDEGERDHVAGDRTLVQKLFEEIAPRYSDRPGGYTRIIRLADRRIGDAGVQVLLQLVEEEAASGGQGGTGRRRKRAAQRHAAVAAAVSAKPAEQEAQDSPAEAGEPPTEDAQDADNPPAEREPDEAQADDAEETGK